MEIEEPQKPAKESKAMEEEPAKEEPQKPTE